MVVNLAYDYNLKEEESQISLENMRNYDFDGHLFYYYDDLLQLVTEKMIGDLEVGMVIVLLCESEVAYFYWKFVGMIAAKMSGEKNELAEMDYAVMN